MGVRETLDKIENMVATAKTFPFTGHILINDNDLVHYVEELRNDLPKELEKADAIMKQREGILKDAQREAEHIRKEAQDQAALMVEHSEIVMQSKQRGKEILQQTQQQSKEMIDAAKAQAQELQDNVDLYANQVFEQLIAHVSRTFEGVSRRRTASTGRHGRQQVAGPLAQALGHHQTAKAGLNQPKPPAPAKEEEAEEHLPAEQ